MPFTLEEFMAAMESLAKTLSRFLAISHVKVFAFLKVKGRSRPRQCPSRIVIFEFPMYRVAGVDEALR